MNFGSHNSSGKYVFGNVTYGTVGVLLEFAVDINKLKSQNASIIHTSFTGRDIGTQIRGWS